MRPVSRLLTLLLVCATSFGGVLPVVASPNPPPIAQDGAADTPTPSGDLPAVELGIAPDAAPQVGSVIRDALLAPAMAAVDVAIPDGPPVVMPLGAEPAAVMADVPADEYGVGLETAPASIDLALHSLYLPAASSGAGGEAQAAAPEAITPAAPDGTVYVYSASTTDGANVAKTTFDVGNTIRYAGFAYNATGAARSVAFTWSLSGPCGNSTLWSGLLVMAPGYGQWYMQGVAPNCPGTFTYTFKATYAGSTTTRSATFRVNSPGAVTASSVATQDSAGVAKNSFAAGASINYVTYLNNTTGATRSVYLIYTLAGPCGAGTLWSGYINTASGVQGWTLNRAASTCVGAYTFTARVTYNGVTTTRSISYSIYQPTTVTVTAVRTGTRANVTRTSFVRGAPMRYFGTFSNNTGAVRSASTVWSIVGPGCSGTLWSGPLSVAAGTGEWYLDGVAPTCLGAYTFSLAVTYNGQTTKRTSAYTVMAQ